MNVANRALDQMILANNLTEFLVGRRDTLHEAQKNENCLSNLNLADNLYDQEVDKRRESTPKRNRRANRVWFKCQEFFYCAETASNYVLSEKMWNITTRKTTMKGVFKLRILIKSVKSCIVLLDSIEKKNAQPPYICCIIVKVRRFHSTIDIKEFVKQELKEGVKKPNAILALIRRYRRNRS